MSIQEESKMDKNLNVTDLIQKAIPSFKSTEKEVKGSSGELADKNTKESEKSINKKSKESEESADKKSKGSSGESGESTEKKEKGSGESKDKETKGSGGGGGEKNEPTSNSQSPSTSPPSVPPPPPHNNSSSSESQSSPPPPLASPPPTSPPSARLSPPSPPPSSPLPPPSSSSSSSSSPPPQPTPKPTSKESSTSPEPESSSSPPPPSLPPPPPPPPAPAIIASEDKPPKDSQPTPIPPPPPSTPSISPPPPVSSGVVNPPPPSSLSSPPIPQTPNAPKSPTSPMPPKAPKEGSTPQLPSSSSSSSSSSPPPPSHPAPPSHNYSRHANQTNANSGNGNNKENNDSYSEKALIGVGVSFAVIIVFLAIAFFVKKRRKDKRVVGRPNQHYMPPANFSIKSDGYNYYGQKASYGNNSGQNSSSGYSSEGQRPVGTPDSATIGSSKILFTFDELAQITSGFSKKNIIGEGGYGCVYKGFLSDRKIVAVKQLKHGCGQGYREFKAEVEIISRIHHRHLVSLVGYCISEQHRLLVYEFVPNKTLEYHLHNKSLPVLDWTKRVKIAIGAAKGLAYLHEDCHPKIIHRDIKSANILLHDDFEAQVADFGLARLNDSAHTHVSTRVMGTFGYLAPEYASSGKLTDRSDVFSFGVVLLELITGRRSVDQSQPLGEESLVEWARPHLIEAIETGDVSDLVDPRLQKHYVEREVYRMIETAASCVRHSAPKRPRMVQVVRALDNEGDQMSDLTNGVKVGQSTAYNSGQYSQDIRNFRRMTTFASDDFSDSGASSDYTTSLDYNSHDSESRALNATRRR